MTIDRAPHGRVALFRLVARTTARARAGSTTGSPEAWRRWALTLTLGFLGCMALTWLATHIGEGLAGSGTLHWEEAFIRGLEDDRLLSFHDATWLQAFGSSAMMIPLVILATGMAAWMHRPIRAATVLAVFLLAKVVIFSGWGMWARARPDFINEGIGVPAGLGAYPSGHMVQLIAIYGLLVWFWVRSSRSIPEQLAAWLLLAALALATAFARLRVGAHWPSDLVAGAALGLALLLAAIVAIARAESTPTAPAPPPRQGAGAHRPST